MSARRRLGLPISSYQPEPLAKTSWKRVFALVGFGLLWMVAYSGCAGKPVNESDPASVFEDAEADLKADRYQIAIDKFRTVKNKFPYSKYSAEAQLKIGDSYFLQESFGEAAVSYESFRDLHPRHEKAAYALFRMGKSYFKDIPSTVARDHASAHRALEIYGEFLSKYPTDPNAEEARKDSKILRESLASKEIYIGDFYMREGKPSAAAPRFLKASTLYPDTEAAKMAKDKYQAANVEVEKRASEKKNEKP